MASGRSSRISERTKAALAAAKRRGVLLGGYREGAKLTRKARLAGNEAVAQRARDRASDLAPVIAELREAGVTSLSGVARELTARGIPTASGGSSWQAAQVARVLQRLAS